MAIVIIKLVYRWAQFRSNYHHFGVLPAKQSTGWLFQGWHCRHSHPIDLGSIWVGRWSLSPSILEKRAATPGWAPYVYTTLYVWYILYSVCCVACLLLLTACVHVQFFVAIIVLSLLQNDPAWSSMHNYIMMMMKKNGFTMVHLNPS